VSAKRTATKATKVQQRTSEPLAADGGAAAADYYDQTHDLSGFDGGEAVHLESAPTGARNVTLSIRLSPAELQLLGQRAAAAGIRLTTYIRGAALQAEAPPDDDDLIDTASEVVDLIAALRASVDAAKARREQATRAERTASAAS
jgi:predicted DNA binding CopG/RHH family protein